MTRALGLTFLALLAGLVLLAAQHAFGEKHVQVPGDAIAGGRIYDNWIVALDAPLPAGSHPLWDNQDFNERSGVITWRCVECHGWDYKGVDGAYGPYSAHYTGFRGLEDTVGATQEEVLRWLDGTLSSEHNFQTVMSTTALNDLAAFLRTQQINTDLFLDSSGISLGDREEGRARYLRACASCHGDTGESINFGTAAMPLYLGDKAVADPWQTVHKMRFGTPNESAMPATETLGWSLRYVANVLAHMQTLPRGNPDLDSVEPNRMIEVESQAEIEPIVWATFAIMLAIAVNVGWEFYTSRKSGK
jgi:cytochrome c553